MEQTEAPIVDENLQARQLVQPEALFCEYVPAAQFMQTEDEAAERVPAVQLVHAVLPMVFLFEQAPHCVQGPPAGGPCPPDRPAPLSMKSTNLPYHSIVSLACFRVFGFLGASGVIYLIN